MATKEAAATFTSIKFTEFNKLRWTVPDPADPTKLVLHPAVRSSIYKDKGGKWSVQLTRTDLPDTAGGQSFPMTRFLPYKLKFDVKGDKDAKYNESKGYDTSVGVALAVKDAATLAALNDIREAHIIAALKHRAELVPPTTSDAELARRIRKNFGWHDHEASGTTKSQRKELSFDRNPVIGPCPEGWNHGYLALKIHEKNLEMPKDKSKPDFELKPDTFVDMKAAVEQKIDVPIKKEILHEGSLMAADVCLLGVNVQEQEGFARWKIFGGLVKEGRRSMNSGAAALDDTDREALAAYIISDDEEEMQQNPQPPSGPTADQGESNKRKLEDFHEEGQNAAKAAKTE